MRRLAILALALSAMPLAPASAAARTVTYVAERVADEAPLMLSGSAGVGPGEHAFAAVATVAGTSAEGALFFGLSMDTDLRAGSVHCGDLPGAGQACSTLTGFGGLGFVVWWDEAAFDRAFVVLRGNDVRADLHSPGWTLREWTGATRVVTDADVASAGTALGRGVSAFAGAATAPGSAGSVAIGKLPCMTVAYANAGAGAGLLTGGASDAVASCADFAPPAAVSDEATTWSFTGAGTGVADTPARLVVIDAETA